MSAYSKSHKMFLSTLQPRSGQTSQYNWAPGDLQLHTELSSISRLDEAEYLTWKLVHVMFYN